MRRHNRVGAATVPPTNMHAGRNPNMSNPMNQQTLVENIDLYLADGMPVYDMNGAKWAT